MKSIITASLITVAGILMGSCNSCQDRNKVDVDNTEITNVIKAGGTGFIKNGNPYRYIGTNMWYASVLASEGEGGNRERFCSELDQL
jgi:hypothetical protein